MRTFAEKAILTISLPRTMKESTAEKLQEGRFSTPSEYIRSLIRDEQDVASSSLPILPRRNTVEKVPLQAKAVKRGKRKTQRKSIVP